MSDPAHAVSDLSDSAQNHLKAIWVLQEWTDVAVTTSMVADHLGLRQSSVSDAIRKLGEQGLVEHARYGAVALTDRGRDYALAMVRRHRLIETFLVQVLHYGWDEVHDEAEILEHAVSELMIQRIAEVLGHPDRDPHGDPIPAADGTVPAVTAHRLGAVGAGRFRIERISDADPARLEFFAARGLVVGAAVEIVAAEPYSDAVRVRTGGADEPISLGEAAQAAVWVSPADEGGAAVPG